MSRNRRLANGGLSFTRDPQRGILETRGITGSEQLLRVRGPSTWAAQLFRQCERLIEDVIGGPNAALPSTRRRRCRGIKSLHRLILPNDRPSSAQARWKATC